MTRRAVGGECNLIVLDAGDVQQFLKDALAHGPKCVSDVEEAAEKAHIDIHTPNGRAPISASSSAAAMPAACRP